ncbi:hypothetical protein [Spiroplasma taiwanense]|uniref:Uncharacterized protein n=1 Tax=Spiroplasma taiwanense CT-1 TaxID=1276220 RepID=S5LZH6_9MOLU|nr:hypothetical protein [Spiroplasma taiwanense]AGR41112.1 hypothetical protein STAIW_v1c04690 [Spiroplasma taiwanense CT-1]
MKKYCEMQNCNKELNSIDPKRIYVYDDKIEDEIPLSVCDNCYTNAKKEENDIDWSHSVYEENE